MSLFRLDTGGAVYWVSAEDEVVALELLEEEWINNEWGNEDEVVEELQTTVITELDKEDADQTVFHGERYVDDKWEQYTCSLWEEYCTDTDDRIISCSEWP